MVWVYTSTSLQIEPRAFRRVLLETSAGKNPERTEINVIYILSHVNKNLTASCLSMTKLFIIVRYGFVPELFVMLRDHRSV